MRCSILLLALALLVTACSAPGLTPDAPTRTPATRIELPSPTALANVPVALAPATFTPTRAATPTSTIPATATVTPPAAAFPNPPIVRNPFGLLISTPRMSIQQRLSLAQQLGAIYFRPSDVLTNRWEGICSECSELERSGMGILLTVRNNGDNRGNGTMATMPPSDLEAYKRSIASILDKYNPLLLVVENEESNKEYYSGTAQEYGNELRAACQVAHAQGVTCTNGGIDRNALVLLVWDSYIERGETKAACDFVTRSASVLTGQNLVAQLCAIKTATQSPEPVQSIISQGKALLEVYRTAGIDLVNFHWSIPDPEALKEAVAFLKNATGRAVMSNEMGTPSDDLVLMDPLLSQVAELGLTYVIWKSVDEGDSRSLVNPDGSLRPAGKAFQSFIQSHYP